jgi:DNA invertase Pin-like site-specific DNA recombinase
VRAFGYVRVSGRGQLDGDGPQRQRDVIQKFCQEQRLAPLLFFAEDAVSGTIEGLNRPMFLHMIQAIEQCRKDCPQEEVCIVLERLDRLARDLIVSEIILKECSIRSIPVYAADQGQKLDQASVGADPTRKLIRQILGAVSEWEKSVIVKKLRAARDRKRQETGRCEGVKPYGDLEAEIAVLRWLEISRVNRNSYETIARGANALGYVTRSGRPWTKAAVYQVLNRR